MLYALMVTAAATSAVVTALCFLLKWNKTWIVALLQFVISFGATYAVAQYAARPGFEGNLVTTSLITAAVVPVIFSCFSLFFGPLDSRKPGIADKKYTEKKEQKMQKRPMPGR